MRISEAYTHFRLSGEDIRLKNRAFKYNAVIRRSDKGHLPELSFYDLKSGALVASADIVYEQITAMLQSEAWELIPAVKAVSA